MLLSEEWQKCLLSSVIERGRKITYGIVQPGGFVDDGIPLVRGGDYSDGWASLADIKRVRTEVDAPYKRSRLRSGDILLTIVGANTGHTAVVPDWLDGANITQTTARVAVDQQLAAPTYILHWLRSSLGQDEVRKYVKGAAQPGLNLEDVERFVLLAPPLSEQRRIAAVLDIWDEAIAIAARSVELIELRNKRLAKYVWQDSAANYSGTLGTFCRPRQWPTPGKDGMIGGEVPVYGANGVIGAIDRTTHTVPTIAIGCRGSIGEVHIVPAPAYITGNAMALDDLDTSQLRQKFLYHQLRFVGFGDIASGSSQPQITQKDMRAKLVWVPDLSTQRRVETLLDVSDTEHTSMLDFVTLLLRQKHGLMQKLLTGEWRVPATGDAFVPGSPAADRLKAAK